MFTYFIQESHHYTMVISVVLFYMSYFSFSSFLNPLFISIDYKSHCSYKTNDSIRIFKILHESHFSIQNASLLPSYHKLIVPIEIISVNGFMSVNLYSPINYYCLQKHTLCSCVYLAICSRDLPIFKYILSTEMGSYF